LFVLGFYTAGAAGVPRRYAMEPPPGPDIAGYATAGAIAVLLGLLVVLAEGIRLARRPAVEETP
jgi:heme/copper-type cytochrome/quinol oxidase subunit 1